MCFKRSRLDPLFKCLPLQGNMCLQPFRQDLYATPKALQFPVYLLQLCERKLQIEEEQPFKLPASVNVLSDEKEMIEKLFQNLPSNFGNDEWLLQQAILTNRNKALFQLDGRIGSTIPGTLQRFLSAEMVDMAEIYELRYTVELLNSIAGTT